MNRSIQIACVLLVSVSVAQTDALAQGFGGFQGGGFSAGGFRAGGGGSGAGGLHAGGFDGAGFGGAGGSGGAGHFHAGGFDARGFHAGGLGGLGGGGGATAHAFEGPLGTTFYRGAAGVEGAAVGPGGAPAGGRCWRPAACAEAAWAAAVWTAASWSAVDAWFAWNNAAPCEYAYGNTIVYQDGAVYYGTHLQGTAAVYYQQAADLASTAADAASDQDSQWLPLGVFGLMRPGTKTPDAVFQLAVDKNGAVRGNCYHEATKATVPVQGAVDKRTQRVAWRIGNDKDLVVETGLYSLTQDESTALVHFGPKKTTQYLMVRVKQPAQDGTPGGASGG